MMLPAGLPATTGWQPVLPRIVSRKLGAARRVRYPSGGVVLFPGTAAPNCCGEALRIISAQCKFSAVAQRDRYGVQSGNIVEPAVRRQMNSATVPPTNANRSACGDLRQRNLFADEPDCKAGPQSFAADLDCQFAKYNRANEKDHLDHCIDQHTVPMRWRSDSDDRNKNSRAKKDADY